MSHHHFLCIVHLRRSEIDSLSREIKEVQLVQQYYCLYPLRVVSTTIKSFCQSIIFLCHSFCRVKKRFFLFIMINTSTHWYSFSDCRVKKYFMTCLMFFPVLYSKVHQNSLTYIDHVVYVIYVKQIFKA
jgi:hypothetical protein